MSLSRTVPFSALCSVYINEKAEYLERALQSIDAQTVKPNEVIVVKDGPVTTELQTCIDRWRDLINIKEVKLANNVGLGQALNKGLESCTFDLVARFDTDDINRPKRFEIQLEYFKRNPDLVLLSSSIEEFNEVPGDMGRIKAGPASSNIANVAKTRNPFNHMSVMFRKDKVQQVGGYKHLFLMEDYYLWLRMINANFNMMIDSNVLVDARVGNGMLERRKGLKYVKSEWMLAKIKYQLEIAGVFNCAFSFILRSLPRVLPSFILKLAYSKWLRK